MLGNGWVCDAAPYGAWANGATVAHSLVHVRQSEELVVQGGYGGVVSSHMEGARLAARNRAGLGYCLRAEDQQAICVMGPQEQQLACLTGY